MLLLEAPRRPLHVVAGKVFLWHQKHPCLADLQKLAWDAGLVIILTTDASSEVGWGVTAGTVWHQGSWLPEERDMSINWKELKTYEHALICLEEVLRDKLIFVKLDNSCAVHYINAGSGRIQLLADLAKCIRMRETRLGVESVAVHLPGEKNVTADGLSRLPFSLTHCFPLLYCGSRHFSLHSLG